MFPNPFRETPSLSTIALSALLAATLTACGGSSGGGNSSSSSSEESSSSSSNSSSEESSSSSSSEARETSVEFVGNITTRGQVRDDFTMYWDQITPENEGKWGSVEGTRDDYNWGPLDDIYDYARANDIPVKGHVLVWGSNQRPGWIDDLSPEEQREEIEEWISDYCERYPDTEMIDVVNEALDGHAPAEYAESAFGDDWIIESFKLAREHCPDAILIYNDFNFLTWDNEAIIELITPAVESGYVDALGVQAHGLYDPRVWSAQEIEDNLDNIAELGLPIYVSEYDIGEADDQQQLEYMQTHFPIFYEHPDVVGITLWGYIEGATWIDDSGLMSSDGQQRPAMQWLMEYLNR